MPVVQRDDNKVWLAAGWDAEAGIGWDAGLKALARAIELTTEQSVDFDELLVRAGEALAATACDVYHESTYLSATIDGLAEAAKSFGFAGRWAFSPFFDESRDLLAAEIDAGRPVPIAGAAGPYSNLAWGLALGYDRAAPQFMFAGYRGGARWMPVLGDNGDHQTGPWVGRVRGLLPRYKRMVIDRPLFILGPRQPAPDTRDMRLGALRLAIKAMTAPPIRINGQNAAAVTYHFGVDALRLLHRTLGEIDYPAIRDQVGETGSHELWDLPAAVGACAELVMRGRRAASRVFRRWADEDAALSRLREIVPLLEAGAADAWTIARDVAPRMPWEEPEVKIEDPFWRQSAAKTFGHIADHDEQCLENIRKVAAA